MLIMILNQIGDQISIKNIRSYAKKHMLSIIFSFVDIIVFLNLNGFKDDN